MYERGKINSLAIKTHSYFIYILKRTSPEIDLSLIPWLVRITKVLYYVINVWQYKQMITLAMIPISVCQSISNYINSGLKRSLVVKYWSENVEIILLFRTNFYRKVRCHILFMDAFTALYFQSTIVNSKTLDSCII